jgi:hypothetical protein
MSKILVVLLVVAAIGLAAYVYVGDAKTKPKHPPHAGPPPSAQFVPDPPEAIIGAVGSSKRTQRSAAVDSFVGLWVPAEGWEGVVEDITDEKDGPALRMRRLSSRMIGGESWIVALVDEDHGVSKGQTVRVQGKIRDVRIQVAAAAATVSNSIVLEEARVVSHQ